MVCDQSNPLLGVTIMLCIGRVRVHHKQSERAFIVKAPLADPYDLKRCLKKRFKHFLMVVTFLANVFNF